ncbi:MAG: hypothetical protein MJY72_07855 [Bacteroidales bacterium]|nr:hypothetical protein [Bacteroidales bacterium]
MDIVITYVDGLDPLWMQDYENAVGGKLNEKRFRDWGTLRYLLRGIRKFMPYIDNVFLVVARESQVPSWVSEKLKIVLHKDIIPKELLPVFNSTAIEMFLHRIPGLSEQFIYFNDDIFPVAQSRPEDFFRDGKVVMKHSRCFLPWGMFKRQTQASDRLAKSAAGACGIGFMRPQHICSPMLRSCSEELYRLKEKEILSLVTPLRKPFNVNQYIFTDYLYYTGRTIQQRRSKKHFSLAASSMDKIESFILNPTAQFACINDVNMPQEKYLECRKRLLAAFETLLPEPCDLER